MGHQINVTQHLAIVQAELITSGGFHFDANPMTRNRADDGIVVDTNPAVRQCHTGFSRFDIEAFYSVLSHKVKDGFIMLFIILAEYFFPHLS